MLIRLAKKRFVQNVGKLMLGSGLGQVVSFLAAPIIARLYPPESIGEQSALFSIVGPIMCLASLAFPIAIVIARSDEEAFCLERLAFWSSLIISVAITFPLLAHDMWLLRKLGLEEVGTYADLIPILVVLITLNMSATYLMTRYEVFGLSAKTAVLSAAVGNLSKLALGAFNPSALSLIAGNALGYIVGPLMSLRLRRSKLSNFGRTSMPELKATARRHRDFPLLRAPQNFLAAISHAMPIIGLMAGFGPASAGHYAMGIALVGAPITLMGNAVQSVLYPRLTAAARAGENTSKLLLSSTLALLVVGAPFFLLVAFFGRSFFAVLLGQEWLEAGVYSILLIPWLWLGLANRPAVALAPAIKLQHGLLIYELIGGGARAAAILIGVLVFDDARWTVGMFSMIGALSYLVLIIWIARKSQKRAVGNS